MKPLLVTAFDRFGMFEENPSAVLVANIPLEEKVILPVCYREVGKWIETQAGKSSQPRALLMLGVCESAETFRLELRAQNYAGDRPDEEGFSWGACPIDPLAPPILDSTLFFVVFPERSREAECAGFAQKPQRKGALQIGGAYGKGMTAKPIDGVLSFAKPSWDAGDYLCNFAYFLALLRLPGGLCGFIHVPPLSKVPLATQQAWLERVIDFVLESI